MKLRVAEPDYSQFDQASEEVGDADLANRLIRLFKGLEQGTVAIFNGGWGVGKTTFIRRWIAQLERESVPAVYLNAFSVDYLESPFIAIAGAISEAVENAHKEHDPKYTRFLKSAARVGRSLAATATKIGVRAATLGAVKSTDLEEFADGASDPMGDYAEESVKRLIEQHSVRQKEVQGLRESLAELPKLLAGTDAPDHSPLIIVIDELDRCRPDFALGLMEILKHFFGAPKTHFLLVVNRRQIENSILHRYGDGVSPIEYLRKFYDFQIDYDIDYSDRHGSKIGSFLSKIHNSLLLDVQDGQYIRNYIRDIARAHRLSLRDIENVYTNLSLAYAVSENRYRPAVLIAVLTVLKVIAPATYAKAKTGDLTYSELNKIAFADRNWGEFDVDRLRRIFQWHLDPNITVNDPEWGPFRESEWRSGLERLETIKFIANAIVDRFEPASPRAVND